MIEQTGLFLQARYWEMADERTGVLRRGTKLRLAVPRDPENPNVKGYDVLEYSGGPELYGQIDEKKVLGKNVIVECDLRQSGRNAKLIPRNIALAK